MMQICRDDICEICAVMCSVGGDIVFREVKISSRPPSRNPAVCIITKEG